MVCYFALCKILPDEKTDLLRNYMDKIWYNCMFNEIPNSPIDKKSNTGSWLHRDDQTKKSIATQLYYKKRLCLRIKSNANIKILKFELQNQK